MVTAVDDLDAARSALTAGASDYVTKPFTFEYLDAVLDIHVPTEPSAGRPSSDTTDGVVAESTVYKLA